ncbi:MAG: hypothetical protein CVU38_06725 [Chloroflexi bacterium HGW-Chloroflexi-1]|nr:MAG: hypothetical protein CVU38_06725 [Chloroflexi bacterium HGW-Chloroflexi-1]
MSKLKSFLGYLLAALGIPVILVTFMGASVWMKTFVSITGVTISPWYTGGEVAYTVRHDGYRTEIYTPVFQALIGERDEGFVQVAWTPKGLVPARIDEEIDYNGDGVMDFRVQWDTKTDQATITPYSAYVLGLEGVYALEESHAVRVDLRNTR